MNTKRQPIQKRIQNVSLLIVMSILLLMSILGLASLLSMKKQSVNALLDSTKNNMQNILNEKVNIADIELNIYKNYISTYAKFINMIYTNPENYKKEEVFPPNKNLKDTYSMQRFLLNKTINYENVKEDIELLSNLEYIWAPMMEKENDIITSVYACTKNGAMVTYDKFSDLGNNEPNEESYFNFQEREWYKNAKTTNEIVFSDLSQDFYGKGLTLTCSAPFYDSTGTFAGVVGMDFLVTDLQKAIINLDLGEEVFAFLVDGQGDIVASPYVKHTQTKFDNINNKDSIYNPISFKILNTKGDIDLLKNGTYCVYQPINEINWRLCIQIPESQILQPVNEMNKNILAMFITFITLFIVFSIIVIMVVNKVTNKITKPLLRLKNEVDIVSNGELDRNVSVIGNDEISDLATAFNNMTKSLKTYINDLTSMTAEKERIGAELDVATHIQASMLPTIFPNDSRYEIYATMDPAKEVGGDFYDFFMVDEKHLAIVVADVSGKGIPAALFMVIGKTLIKDHTNINDDLSKVFDNVNNLLCESNSENLFITAFEAVINLETGEAVYVNAGHEFPYIYKKNKEFTLLKTETDFVLAGFEEYKYKSGKFKLEKGDKLFQYTDGVTEATNSNNELYGINRLNKVLNNNIHSNSKNLLQAIKVDIDKFVGEAPQFDDITMLCLELKK